MWDSLFGWPVVGAVVATLIGLGWVVVSIPSPQFNVAQWAFTLAALILTARAAHFVISTEGPKHSNVQVVWFSFLVFGAIASVWVISLRWVDGLRPAKASAHTENGSPPSDAHARLEIARIAPIPLLAQKASYVFINVSYNNLGEVTAQGFRVRTTVLPVLHQLSAEEVNAYRDRNSTTFLPKDLSSMVGDDRECYKNDPKIHFFSIPERPSTVADILTNEFDNVISGRTWLYVFITMVYRDRNMPDQVYGITETGVYFNGDFETPHECYNRALLREASEFTKGDPTAVPYAPMTIPSADHSVPQVPKPVIDQLAFSSVSVCREFSLIETGKTLRFRVALKNEGPLGVADIRIAMAAAIPPRIDADFINTGITHLRVEEQTPRAHTTAPFAIGVGNEAYQDINLTPLEQWQETGILDGTVHVCMFVLATWTMTNGVSGATEIGIYLQKPQSKQLGPEDVKHVGLIPIPKRSSR